uniref:EOG090X0FJX n=1 Tax=Evadne anonyx TaxID=141404 RepID=A0A9N6ZFM8_9CRUS|nr:EOG090X0FJX [Evadne anonyx]
MESNDFELETKLRNLTLEQDVSSDERENRLAALIATCVADMDSQNDDQSNQSDEKEDDQPSSLIVTNLPHPLFAEQHLKMEFEKLFRTFDATATFHYLKSFRRARVDFSSPSITSKARIHLHQTPFGENVMNCFFGQPPLNKNTQQFLQIPPPVRQFLISPPASPPVGWTQAPETGPVVNFDLLAVIAALGPGEKHELLPATENKPGIVVHVCDEQPEGSGCKQRICQTPCPKRI